MLMLATNRKYGPPDWPDILADMMQFRPSPELVNKLVNHAIRYTRDGEDDWQSPSLTAHRMKGDCEDIAILKAALLPGYTRYISVGHTSDGKPHAVLLVEVGGVLCVLDNLKDEILSLDDSGFKPLYGLGPAGNNVMFLELKTRSDV